MAEWQNLSSSDFSFRGTYLPDKPPSSVKLLQGLLLCCAFSVEGEAGARAGARKSRRNPGATKCPYHHHSLPAKGLPPVICYWTSAAERKTERKTEYGPHNGGQMAALHAPALAAPPSLLLGDDAGITDY